jgi:hypothetical protein
MTEWFGVTYPGFVRERLASGLSLGSSVLSVSAGRSSCGFSSVRRSVSTPVSWFCAEAI